MKLNKKQKEALKSYLRSLAVATFAFVTSDQMGLDPRISALIAAVVGPVVRAWDKHDTAFGRNSDTL